MDTTVTSLAELLTTIESYSGRVFVYRGQARSEWGLVPSLYRGINLNHLEDLADQIAPHERDLYREFSDKSILYVKERWNPWESMILAQHHGVPTRLLDWTSNLLAAAYFAAASSPESDGVIWCAQPTALPVPPELGRLHFDQAHRLSAIRAYISDVDLPFTMDVSKPFQDDSNVHSDSNNSLSPPFDQSGATDHEGILVFLLSPYSNDRIKAQAGLFSVYITRHDSDIVMDHATYLDAVTAKWGVEILHRLRIPARSKPGFISSLENNGVNAFTLFPDLQGLSTYLQGKHAEYVRYLQSLSA